MKSPAERLILTIAKLGGFATYRNIARAHLTGDALARAKAETVDLVVFEPVYLKREPKSQGRSRSRSCTARLTTNGIWRAAQLGARFDPELISQVLAGIEFKDLFDRLRYERNPFVAQIIQDQEDANAYRRLLADEQRMLTELAGKPVRRKRKMTLRRLQRLNAFLASRNKPTIVLPEAYAQPMAAGKIRGREDVAPAPILPAHLLPTPPVNPAPGFTVIESPFCPRCNGDLPRHLIGCPLDGRPVITPERGARLSATSFCERCHMSGNLCRCLNPVEGITARQEIHRAPWAPQAEPTQQESPAADLRAIRTGGFGSAIRGNKVLFDNKEVEPAVFRKRMGL